MGHDDWLASLRRATGDPAALRLLLVDELSSDALQHIGDALLGVLARDDAELDEVLERLVDQLRNRGWDGDVELIDALESITGRRPSTLVALSVELDEVGEGLTQAAGTENYVDLQSGMVWFHSLTEAGMDDELDVDFDDHSRWLLLVGEGAREAHRDLGRFIATVSDQDLARRLSHAIEGREAFGRFRSVLEHHPDEYTRWHRFDADARRGHARRWLANAGYQALPPCRNALP